jgi:hypothetical protein
LYLFKIFPYYDLSLETISGNVLTGTVFDRLLNVNKMTRYRKYGFKSSKLSEKYSRVSVSQKTRWSKQIHQQDHNYQCCKYKKAPYLQLTVYKPMTVRYCTVIKKWRQTCSLKILHRRLQTIVKCTVLPTILNQCTAMYSRSHSLLCAAIQAN